jgi:hypothetical protein
MKKSKVEKLKKAGWRVGTVKEFLGLTDQEMALIEFKRSLIGMMKKTREENKVTQKTLAQLLRSSQSRVAKIEAASSDVSLDLIVRALIVLGITPRKIGKFLYEA